MDTVSTIMTELNRQNFTQKDLADYLHIKKTVITDWKSGKSKSYLAHIKSISEFLNVSVDYLLINDSDQNCADKYVNRKPLLNEDKKAVINLSEIDRTAIQLIQTYNTLSLKNKARAISYILELKNEADENE